MRFIKYFIILILISIKAHATTTITCPTVEDIKNNQFNGWLPLYIDNEELASDVDTELFRKSVARFEAARWDSYYLEAAHCFYSGDNDITHQIILAHDAWRPTLSVDWSWVTLNVSSECKSGAESCAYIL